MSSNIHKNVRVLEASEKNFYTEMHVLKIPVINLTSKYIEKNTECVFFRDDDYRYAITTLNCLRKNNLAITGESGVGKTAFIHFMAKYVQLVLSEYTLAEVNIASIISGCGYRGDFEKKLTSIVELAILHKIIIYFDEAHALSMTGGINSGGIDAMNILKSYLTKGFRCIISTTTEESYLLKNDIAFSRRFRFMELKPLSGDKKREIIISKFGCDDGVKHYLNSIDADKKALFEMIDDVDFLFSARKIKDIDNEIHTEQ